MNQRFNVFPHIPVAVFVVGITVIAAAGSEHRFWPVTPGPILIPCPNLVQVMNLKQPFGHLVWAFRKDKNSEWSQKIGMNSYWEVQMLDGTESSESYCLYPDGMLKLENVTVADNFTEYWCDVTGLSQNGYLINYGSSFYTLLVNKAQEPERNYDHLHDHLGTCTSDTDQPDAQQISPTTRTSEKIFSKANSKTESEKSTQVITSASDTTGVKLPGPTDDKRGITSSTQEPYPERTQDMTSAPYTPGGDLSGTTGDKTDELMIKLWRSIAIGCIIVMVIQAGVIVWLAYPKIKMRLFRDGNDDGRVVFNDGLVNVVP